ncbi:hypothetical protein OHA98_38125 [Streptomyces sp. NBC_00654]|uniref:hypothetical protein n=1 Tax=Streptomyces sp. NBC_00654 TaxID=2975799 RepID=UPI00225ACF39|nr:hypothetical protein [Streptomyces sp. NBC_00654]MCX4970469.1 hypothetical protein [Streptomyces sp. NBC_00654]
MPRRNALAGQPAFGPADDSTQTQERVPAALRTALWPLPEAVLDGIFEDLNLVLDGSPDEDDAGLLHRTRGTLLSLVAAVAHGGLTAQGATDTLAMARSLAQAAPPGDPSTSRARQRRTALAVLALLEVLEPEPLP